MLGNLPGFTNERLLVGLDTSDDAAVYRHSQSLATIHTVDFFTPVVDDPYIFGQIAACNALSDIYAMGGEPRFAAPVGAIPPELAGEVLDRILAGGRDMIRRSGAVPIPGTILYDAEPKFGLSVTGCVRPDSLWKNNGAEPGDILILTKPLGIGIVNTAVKADLAGAEACEAAVRAMTMLNRRAKEILERFTVHACTDVTGFGLLGHGLEMAVGSGVTLQFYGACLPVLPQAGELAMEGMIPAGAYRNRQYVEERLDAGDAEEYQLDLMYDPQTSGGLLASIPGSEREALERAFTEAEMPVPWAVVGDVIPAGEKALVVCAGHSFP